ncbi:MAG: tryptophan-rich sensory protein [Clostridia bacterium]|nr:tryptophan-rich sensory protein [Clostridia bacterium]
MKNKLGRNILIFIISIIIPLAVGISAAFLTMDSMDIYSSIKTPPLSPPSILFPIVWTILYILMGISSALVIINRQNDVENADIGIAYYAISLAFNFVWSIIFFNFRNYLFAFIWLVILLYLIVRTIISYNKVLPIAAYLQIPYALWVAFAGYLNIAIYFLNR